MIKVPRATVVALAATALTVPATTAAFAATVGGTTASVIDASTWTPTSPDPSGVAYNADTGRLVVSDGEVDEMPLYAGSNLYESTLQGAGTGTGTTVPWSNEPTGIGYNHENDQLYISDDDKKSIFVIAGSGADGRFGTADDGARTVFKTSTFGNTDPEDVAYDTVHDQLLLIDGVGRKWFTLTKGVNGKFDGVAPGGDDVATEYDLTEFGAEDPEGIAYDQTRDTVLVVDGSADKIIELDHNGSILNEINIASADIQKAAGITVAPASNGSGARTYYVADRGLDNNSHPTENDGRIHEISATLPPITNRPPAANAGQDLMLDVPETATLVGSASDSDSTALTYSWSKVSGPGTVAFGNAAALTSTATFSAAGTYVVRLTVSDGQLSDSDDTVVSVYERGAVRTVSIPITHGADDALEGGGSTGRFVDLSSADNELGNNGGTNPYTILTGLRFASIPIPAGGQVVGARIQFRVDEVGSSPASYTIRGEASDNAARFASVAGNISARATTTASVGWAPPAWDLIGDAGPAQSTPDLTSILQEIVSRPGWQQGNAAVFTISGTGRRTAEAKDGLAPPVLVLDFRTSGGQSTAPVVSAGADQTVTLPAAATLDGTLTDDGAPAPATTTWSKVSGPGDVTFADAAAVDTTATFSAAGTYTLRLTANDTTATATDDVVVTVQPGASSPPAVSAGPDQTVTLPGTASLDGTATDDGQPGPLTTQWSRVSGPGTVTFGNAAATDTTASFSAAGTYTLRLTASDTAATVQDDVVVTVQAAAAAPTITGRSPAPGATNASTTGNVVVTFSAPVTGVSGTTVQLYRVSTGARVNAAVSYAAGTRQATLNPNATLASGAQFQVRILSGIRNSAGQQVAAETWTFTTAAPSDTTAPSISGRSPAVNATNVGRGANMTVTFSEAVVGASGSTVVLRRPDGTAVPAAVTYSTTARRVTLNPNATLAARTRFTLHVLAGIRDNAGNALPPTSWAFTTGS